MEHSKHDLVCWSWRGAEHAMRDMGGDLAVLVWTMTIWWPHSHEKQTSGAASCCLMRDF